MMEIPLKQIVHLDSEGTFQPVSSKTKANLLKEFM
jgi:hypothetical protein